MTAHRPRDTGPLGEHTLIEILFMRSPAPRSGWGIAPSRRAWRPPTDVYETETQIVVRVEIAGVPPDDIRIALYDRLLSINGVRNDPAPERRAYHQMEVNFGEFRTDVDLPGPVDNDHVDAEYNQGILRVVLPKLHP